MIVRSTNNFLSTKIFIYAGAESIVESVVGIVRVRFEKVTRVKVGKLVEKK